MTNSNVIEFKGKQDNRPDPHLVRHDEYGRPLYCFILEYEHAGHTYGLDLWAYSMEEAAAHAVSMVANLTLVGQKLGEVPA